MTRNFRTPILTANGFTLIELVITIAILSVVAVILIPSMRALNRDRKVRDTARVVGTMFAAARERASVDGASGVEILPLVNASGNYNVPNMGMILYQLRSIPPWNGDFFNSTATITFVSPDWTATLNDLSDMSSAAANIRPDDFIEFNHSGVLFRILTVDPGSQGPVPPPMPGSLTFDVGTHDPALPTGVPLTYRIHRQPVRIASTEHRLPNNLFLNLAISGHGTTPATPPPTNDLQGFQFRTEVPGDVGVRVWFNRDGSVNRLTTRTLVAGTQSVQMESPAGPVYLLMANADDDAIDATQLDGSSWLADDNNVWIVIDDRTGSVSVGNMAEFLSTDSYGDQIHKSRALARDRGSANP